MARVRKSPRLIIVRKIANDERCARKLPCGPGSPDVQNIGPCRRSAARPATGGSGRRRQRPMAFEMRGTA